MDIRRIEGLLSQIEMISRQAEGQDSDSANQMAEIRAAADAIRQVLHPPPESNEPRTRDQITPREWAEYEWHDATAFGDAQRKYIRGLKR